MCDMGIALLTRYAISLGYHSQFAIPHLTSPHLTQATENHSQFRLLASCKRYIARPVPHRKQNFRHVLTRCGIRVCVIPWGVYLKTPPCRNCIILLVSFRYNVMQNATFPAQRMAMRRSRSRSMLLSMEYGVSLMS